MTNSQRSEPNNEIRDAMWRGNGGWEIAATPVLFGLGGWFLDGAIGTRPLLTIACAIVGLLGAVANQYYRYRDRMNVVSAERRELHAEKTRNRTYPDLRKQAPRVERRIDLAADDAAEVVS